MTTSDAVRAAPTLVKPPAMRVVTTGWFYRAERPMQTDALTRYDSMKKAGKLRGRPAKWMIRGPNRRWQRQGSWALDVLAQCLVWTVLASASYVAIALPIYLLQR